jgi:hypothetical protein
LVRVAAALRSAAAAASIMAARYLKMDRWWTAAWGAAGGLLWLPSVSVLAVAAFAVGAAAAAAWRGAAAGKPLVGRHFAERRLRALDLVRAWPDVDDARTAADGAAAERPTRAPVGSTPALRRT